MKRVRSDSPRRRPRSRKIPGPLRASARRLPWGLGLGFLLRQGIYRGSFKGSFKGSIRVPTGSSLRSAKRATMRTEGLAVEGFGV